MHNNYLYLMEDNRILCIDHLAFSNASEGERIIKADYAYYLNKGIQLQCCDCVQKGDADDEIRSGNVYPLFRKNSASRLAGSGINYPAGRTPAERISQKGQAK